MNIRHPHRRRLARTTSVLAAALLVGGLAAGCGARDSDSSKSTDASAPCTGKSSSSASAPKELTLALVPSGDSKKLVDTVKPLEAALTTSLGITVKGVITQDYQAAVEAIGANQAQIGLLPPLQMVQACQRYGAVPALQSVRKGKSTYAAQFFTNKPDKYCSDKPAPDSSGLLFCNGTASGNGPAGLDSIAKAKGAKVVMLESGSSAGYVFPAAAWKADGISVKSDLDLTQVGSHPASVLAVEKGDAEVGVSYWDARSTVVADTPDVKAKLVVFALTKEIPNDGVALSGGLSKEWQDRITKALLDYAATPEGVAALNAIYQITGLAKADPAALAAAQQEANLVGAN
ncbi:phosphate/phosphite/phosphonate ABC transporter substrate-binding protein [Williamsia sp. CHRR-6]|uniref:phosphate/phosphite/phosphonate ABC transporter substrate-binding protein n=1 Tax=Williamsia sp. CHRR-6 TaxID=2835871 RepID=UPI001BDA9E39|nr:phosphate/phosphite/phosphonate ABC transporter substrate-binding protein [Williamsia sp. CHRR-6]MBT0566450.1 phosphate/phosphite/phosphonate ABC transporter substrate-binding protein [Williamsia sp. CHRR-6]